MNTRNKKKINNTPVVIDNHQQEEQQQQSMSTLKFFSKKVERQLMNNRVEYKLSFCSFRRMEYRQNSSIHRAIDNFLQGELMFSHGRTPLVYGPMDYSWNGDTKFYCLKGYSGNMKEVFIVPHDFVDQLDSDNPIDVGEWGWWRYLDMESGTVEYSNSILIRDKLCSLKKYVENCTDWVYHLNDWDFRDSDRDWCITYLDLNSIASPRLFEAYVISSLLIKNLDFSVFDARVEGEGGDQRIQCPVIPGDDIQIIDSPIQLKWFETFTINSFHNGCLCNKHREMYRGFKVHLHREEDEEEILVDIINVLTI